MREDASPSRASPRARPAAGSGAKPGTSRRPARSAAASGRSASSRASSPIAKTCGQCNGQGSVIAIPCRTCRGSGAAAAHAHAQRQDPRRRRYRLAPEAARRGRERRQRRPAGRPLRRAPGRASTRSSCATAHDVVCEVPISFAQAALGAEIEVPTLEGVAQAEGAGRHAVGPPVPAAGQGVPDLHGYGRGDQLVRVGGRDAAQAVRPPARAARGVRAHLGRRGAPDVEELPREGEVDAELSPVRDATAARRWRARLDRAAAAYRAAAGRAGAGRPGRRRGGGPGAARRGAAHHRHAGRGRRTSGSAGRRPRALGQRALRVNLSDVAAMGGRPLAALVALEAPRRPAGRRSSTALMRGMVAEARARTGCDVVGGNLAAAPRLAITVTLVGEAAARLVTRAGARAGDDVWVTGTLGGAGAAVRALLARPTPRAGRPCRCVCGAARLLAPAGARDDRRERRPRAGPRARLPRERRGRRGRGRPRARRAGVPARARRGDAARVRRHRGRGLRAAGRRAAAPRAAARAAARRASAAR